MIPVRLEVYLYLRDDDVGDDAVEMDIVVQLPAVPHVDMNFTTVGGIHQRVEVVEFCLTSGEYKACFSMECKTDDDLLQAGRIRSEAGFRVIRDFAGFADGEGIAKAMQRGKLAVHLDDAVRLLTRVQFGLLMMEGVPMRILCEPPAAQPA